MEDKVIYMYDEKSKVFVGTKVVDSDYVLLKSETEIKKEDALYEPVTFDGTNWVETDKATYDTEAEKQRQATLAEHPELTKPSAEMQAINALALQVAPLLVKGAE